MYEVILCDTHLTIRHFDMWLKKKGSFSYRIQLTCWEVVTSKGLAEAWDDTDGQEIRPRNGDEGK